MGVNHLTGEIFWANQVTRRDSKSDHQRHLHLLSLPLSSTFCHGEQTGVSEQIPEMLNKGKTFPYRRMLLFWLDSFEENSLKQSLPTFVHTFQST